MKRNENKTWNINVSDRAATYVSVPLPKYLAGVVTRLKEHYLTTRNEVVDENIVYHRALQIGIDGLLSLEGISLIDPELDAMEKDLETRDRDTTS